MSYSANDQIQSQVVIDENTSAIYEGNVHVYSDIQALADTVSQDYLITVPDSKTLPVFGYNVQSFVGCKIEIFEGTDRIGTTPGTFYNRNRNSAKIASTLIHKGTSGGTTDGVKILGRQIGSTTSTGKGVGTTSEKTSRVLKRNTKYIFRITSLGANNEITSGLFISELESNYWEGK